jgi:serine/threonine-protein kinase HipA
MKKPPLHVRADKAAVGGIARSAVEPDMFLFRYRLEASTRDAVSLTIPVRPDEYDSMAGLLPIFDMNLPEGALKERLRLQFAKAIPEFDDLDLLEIVGSSQNRQASLLAPGNAGPDRADPRSGRDTHLQRQRGPVRPFDLNARQTPSFRTGKDSADA